MVDQSLLDYNLVDNRVSRHLGNKTLIQSADTQTIAGEEGRWLLDYRTYTAHLDCVHHYA